MPAIALHQIGRRRLLGGLAVAGAAGAGAPLLVQWLQATVASGQASHLPRVAYLGVAGDPLASAFRARLEELGWVDGRTIQLVFSGTTPFNLARADADPLNGPDPAVARFLADVSGRRPAAVIVSTADAYTKKALAATRSIPVVMTASADPVGLGFVTSLAQPGGNATGISAVVPELDAKRLELLRDALPGARRVAVFWNPNDPVRGRTLDALRETARRLGLELVPVQVDFGATRFRLGTAFSRLDIAAEQVRLDALLVLEDAQEGQSEAGQIVAGAQQRRLPALFAFRAGSEQGGLLSYGPNLPALWQRAAEYVDRLLRGARPETLPVEQASSFELVVNADAAQQLGITLPAGLLARATQVLPAGTLTTAAATPPAANSTAHTLTLSIGREPERLDPALGGIYLFEAIVLHLLYRGLFDFDPAGAVVPGLAAELPSKQNGGISADGSVFTVRLKPDRLFSDGSALTAHDLEYSI